ncbi:MAG TPA: M20/M25/M40 family metallo-hydrolase [Gaiellaceae bacterium]|nr:M20/M25/M40 family metallo-hydrolase [Gaiellaceae bacterium]
MSIHDRLDELYAIGGGAGANRVGYTAAEDEAHTRAAGWMREAGLEVEVDPHGNLVGRRGSARVWTGSHLDSVPEGGRLDGALGVLAGIEAAARLPDLPLAVVAFRDEERGCKGSRALAASGPLPGAFLELHHEQGPRLALAGAPLGVVSGIVGYVRGRKVVEGRAGHAGTTPMDARDDALVKAAQEVLRIRDVARGIESAVATVGQLEVEPGGINVIPGRVSFSVDARAPDAERLDRLVAEIGVADLQRVEPSAMAEPARAALRAALESRGLPVLELASGAGHDAGVMASAGVAAGMLFVRAGNGGVSHSPDELSSEQDVELAVEVLTAALENLVTDCH